MHDLVVSGLVISMHGLNVKFNCQYSIVRSAKNAIRSIFT